MGDIADDLDDVMMTADCEECGLPMLKCVCGEDADREMGLDRPWKD